MRFMCAKAKKGPSVFFSKLHGQKIYVRERCMKKGTNGISRGVVVGCDFKQEWLLPWWWKNYSAHNSYPVFFADFGMTPNAIDWCLQRGSSVLISSPKKILEKHEIPLKRVNQWEARSGTGIWQVRDAWFKKPAALLSAPFEEGLWLDLDCQVRQPLDPLFNCLNFGAELGIVREPGLVQECDEKQGLLFPGEISYNSGVIAFRRSAPILNRWMEEILENDGKHIGDQPALCRAIFKHRPSIVELPSECNWLRTCGQNENALIYHFVSGEGKIELLETMERDLLCFVKEIER